MPESPAVEITPSGDSQQPQSDGFSVRDVLHRAVSAHAHLQELIRSAVKLISLVTQVIPDEGYEQDRLFQETENGLTRYEESKALAVKATLTVVSATHEQRRIYRWIETNTESVVRIARKRLANWHNGATYKPWDHDAYLRAVASGAETRKQLTEDYLEAAELLDDDLARSTRIILSPSGKPVDASGDSERVAGGHTAPAASASVDPGNPSSEQPTKTRLKPSVEKAFAAYEYATSKMDPAPSTVQQAYDWLTQNAMPGDGDYNLPRFPTWSRQVRVAQQAKGKQKNSPCGGRDGRSIVRPSQIGHSREE